MNNLQNIKGIYPKWYKYLLIVLLVTAVISYFYTLVLGIEFSLTHVVTQALVSTVGIWGGCIGIVTFSWYKFPWEKEPIKHLVVEVLAILVYLFFFFWIYIIVFDGCGAYGKRDTIAETLRVNSADIAMTILITFLITAIHEAHFFYRQWKINFSKSVSLEKDHLEAQYNALKAQVNPHFLFNSLNSLMTLLDGNDKAEQYLQNLSEYLRYVLMSSQRETVTLREELDNVEKYIILQKLRFGDNLMVDLSINRSSLSLLLPPLVLQMLVENCIQHNIITTDKPLKINVSDDEKRITVTNNLQKKPDSSSTGNGLRNIEGRYRFAQEGNIQIATDETNFSVSVPLLKSKNN